MPDEQNSSVVSQPQQPAKVEFVVPDPESGLFTTYANNVQLGWTNFDVRMIFGEVVDAQVDKLIVEQRAQVTISYLQAKLLMFLLGQAVSQYETIFGELKIPEGLLTFELTKTEAKVTPGTRTSTIKA